jgi:hypothetical protein
LFETSIRTDGRNTFIAETVDTRGEEYKEIDGKKIKHKESLFFEEKEKREREGNITSNNIRQNNLRK